MSQATVRSADERLNKDDQEKRATFEKEAIPHLNALYNTAVHMTRNETEAHDLVQETMLRAYRFFHQYIPGTNCKAWLFRILRNTFINRYRKKTKKPVEIDLDLVGDVPDQPGEKMSRTKILTPEEELLQDLYDDEVSAALENLSDTFREVLLLSDVEGFTYQEIADILDVPIGTVRSRLSRARSEMRDALMDYAIRRGIVKQNGGASSSSEDEE